MEHRAELVEVIRRIRNRWRMRLAARGAVIVFVGTVVALLLSASSLETFRFSVPAIITFRILALAVFAGLVTYAVMPLRRLVSDTQVALYLEEHNPSLEAAILSAVETQSSRRPLLALPSPRRAAGREGHRAEPSGRARDGHRPWTDAALEPDARSVRRGRRALHRVRTGLRAQRPVGAPRAGAAPKRPRRTRSTCSRETPAYRAAAIRPCTPRSSASPPRTWR